MECTPPPDDHEPPAPCEFRDEDLMGTEGKELLGALQDVEASAKRSLPFPHWAQPILSNKGSDVESTVKFRPYLMPLNEDLESKLRKWSSKQRRQVCNVELG